MTQKEILLALAGCKGQYVSAEWQSTVKPAAQHSGVNITKRVKSTVRAGIDYANMARNEGKETGALPWGEWVQFPYVISHKGQPYARLYPTGNGSQRASATFTINGQPATREQVATLLTPSAARDLLDTSKDIACFTVKGENLIALG